MSRIDELINHLCPNGVDFQKIGEICKISRGQVISKDYLRDNSGQYPVYSSQTQNNGIFGYINTYAYDCESITWTTDGANAGSVFFHTAERFSITNVCGLLRIKNENEVSSRYVYYQLARHAKSYVSAGMGNPKLMAGAMSTVKIPIPPIEIQQEIVKILDAFSKLEAELEAELEARQYQYTHYRDQLLTFPDGTSRWAKVSEIASLSYGFTAKAEERGDCRFIRITDITDGGKLAPDNAKFVNLEGGAADYLVKRGDILMARTGATFGKTVLIEDDKPAVFASFLIKIRLNSNEVLPAYYWHFSQSSQYWQQANSLVSRGGQPQFNGNVLKDVRLQVPPIEEQKRIVSILDKLDAIVSDLNSGLPAELNARRQQYEHYRDRLLTFKEAI